MKSKLKEIELNKEFPCLMEFRIGGKTPAGIYLVDYDFEKVEYLVCLVYENVNTIFSVGKMYTKKSLNLEEWFFLPKDTQVTLIN